MLRMLLLMAIALNALPTFARTVTDHAGHVVQIPDAPQRIVSLHDWTLTVMAHELGAPLIASTGRVAADGSLFMRGARELFALDFTQLALASVHGKPDLERIMALKPDLILANVGDYQALHESLSTLAPTLMFNPEQGRPMLDLYRDLANWLGRTAEFNALEQHYRAQLSKVRQQLTAHGQSYVALLVNGRDGTVQVLKEYGALTTVMDDIGLQRMPVTQTMRAGSDRMIIGAELIESIDADYIVSSYLPEQGENAQTIYRDFEHIAPGALGFLKAPAQQQMFSFSRYQVYPPSFKGLEITLGNLQAAISAGVNKRE